MKKRLFIISNRLPVTVSASKENIEVTQSSGGLVSAITGYLTNGSESGGVAFSETFWVGVAGCTASTWQKAADKIPGDNFNYLPVYIPRRVYDQYYNGFSNSVIWPLFHYFPSYVEYNHGFFSNYIEANTAFLKTILEAIRPGDVIWIHDYHLMPLATMIRDAQPDVTIGFFLHVPFPSYELFRLMPTKWQEQIMEGILGADLVGFHTIDYASHFLTSAQMILGLGNEMHAVRYKNRLVKVDVFPISIDFDRFYDAYDTQGVVANRNTLHERFGNKKVIFSVDRLDYTKGISNRLMAFDNFLKTYPQYVEKVVFILVIVPSRDSIAKYNEKKKFIDEYIGNFNSSTGTVLWQPIIYQYNSLEFDELVALYSFCDLALITPLRDGMNLVAKEFVASRKDKRGVLVISEMAGAARELTDALTINPNDIEEMAMKIKIGLEMSGEEQAKAMTTMQQRIKQYDVHAWADDFLYQLKKIKEKQKEFEVKYIDEQISEKLRKQYRESTNRLFLLDYDGTLISFSSMPEMAKPGKELLALLNELATSPGNTVYLISGRDSKTLDSWFGQVPVNIVAEHGAKIKEQGGKWHNELGSPVKWKTSVADIMEQYVKRCVNSFIETKDFSVAWHYRNANPEQGRLRASELYQQLEGYISSLGLQVLMGNKVIEVRNSGINKGYATKKILAGSNYDFIITFGDDTTDEDMFMELADVPQASTIKVGPEPSYARYNVATPEAVIKLLESINRGSGNDEKIQNAG